MAEKRRRKCRYYVNSNFIIGLVEGRVESLEFARRHRDLCTSSLVFLEARLKGRDPRPLQEHCKKHGITVVRPTAKTVALLRSAARKQVKQLGLSSRHIPDFMHVLFAKTLHALFVTADRTTCRRARDLGIECIYLPDWWRQVAQELGGDKQGDKRSKRNNREARRTSRKSRKRRR